MIDRAIGGLVPLVQDDLSINRAVVSFEDIIDKNGW